MLISTQDIGFSRQLRSSPRVGWWRSHRFAIQGLGLVALVGGFALGVVLQGTSVASTPPEPALSGALEQSDVEDFETSAATPSPSLPESSTAHDAHIVHAAFHAYEETLPEEIYEPAESRGQHSEVLPDLPLTSLEQVARLPEASSMAHPAERHSLPTWRRYAAAAPVIDGRPMVAIVIDDLGLDRRRTRRTIDLPGPLTLSFLTYAGELPKQTASARNKGHELLVHVGMEPVNKATNAGPNVLHARLSMDEIRRRLTWGLERFGGYVGINNHMGSGFTTDVDGMAAVMGELDRRGLLFLDSRTTAKSVGRAEAVRKGVPFAERNVFLDPVGTDLTVEHQLAELERIAIRYGRAIAIGHPHDGTLNALERWIGGLEARGFALVPLSTIVSSRMGIQPTTVQAQKL